VTCPVTCPVCPLTCPASGRFPETKQGAVQSKLGRTSLKDCWRLRLPAKLVCPSPVRSSVVTRLSPKSATFTTPYLAATCACMAAHVCQWACPCLSVSTLTSIAEWTPHAAWKQQIQTAVRESKRVGRSCLRDGGLAGVHPADEQVGRLQVAVDHHRPAAEQPQLQWAR